MSTVIDTAGVAKDNFLCQWTAPLGAFRCAAMRTWTARDASTLVACRPDTPEMDCIPLSFGRGMGQGWTSNSLQLTSSLRLALLDMSLTRALNLQAGKARFRSIGQDGRADHILIRGV